MSFLTEWADVQEAFLCPLRKFLRATTGQTGQNNSCQQAPLSLAFCMHVLSVFTDTMVRRAIGVSLTLRKCLRPTMVMEWDGLAELHTSACPSIPQACTSSVSRHESQTAAGGLYTVYALTVCAGPRTVQLAETCLLTRYSPNRRPTQFHIDTVRCFELLNAAEALAWAKEQLLNMRSRTHSSRRGCMSALRCTATALSVL